MDMLKKEAECDTCATDSHQSSAKTIVKVEKSMISTMLATLVFLALIEVVAYYGFFRTIPNFFAKYGYYLFFLVLAVVINATAVWHVKAYRHVFSCTVGMMIGMTIGMTAGFSVGLLVGATNGMFIGGVAGLLIGMLAGSYAGWCCGIMGLMEGMMAGLMGGIMGAMTSVMTLNDNIKVFVPILMVSIVAILAGMLVMIYQEEVKKRSEVVYKGFEFLPFITINFITMIGLTFLIVYGPRSFLFS